MTKRKNAHETGGEKAILEAINGVLAGAIDPEKLAELGAKLKQEREEQAAKLEQAKPKTRRPHSSANAFKFEVKAIKALEPKAQEFTARDTTQPGLALRVSPKGRKTFIVEARVRGGAMRRITIGPFGKVTLAQAQLEAKQIMGQLAQGIDPSAVKAQQRREGVTLQQARDDYLAERKLKPRTQADVMRCFRQFEDWLPLRVKDITPTMCEDRHRAMTARAKSSGLFANLCFRYLRAVLNHASVKHSTPDGSPLLTTNPVARLSDVKQWNKMKRRRSFVHPDQMPQWWQAVTEGLAGLKFADEIRDLLLLSMMTGVRPGEALGLKWEGVDFQRKTLTFFDTKNGSDHELPLAEWLGQLLKARAGLLHPGPYVFTDSKGKRPKDLRSAQRRLAELTDIHVMPSDLRRTFITAAEALDVGPYSLKRLLNHTIDNGDVTAGYVIPSLDRLRPTMQRIEDALLRHAKQKSGEVVEFRRVEG